MMFYKLLFDISDTDLLTGDSKNYIYAETSNLNEIIFPGIKKGFFENIIFSQTPVSAWPNIEFYYSSKASNEESDFLLNSAKWPLIHRRCIDIFNENGIEGLMYYPIRLIDVENGNINHNYFLMYIVNFIDAFDLDKSRYQYNAKYNFYTFFPQQTFLNYEMCKGYDIFRCKKSVAPIFVSERFRDIVLKHNLTGFLFSVQK